MLKKADGSIDWFKLGNSINDCFNYEKMDGEIDTDIEVNLEKRETSGSRHYRPTPSSAYAIHLVY